jgi:RNA polymerase sigma-70 factor (ECF subfamily)
VSSLADVQSLPRYSSPEQILVDRLKAGDAEAFEELVRTAGGRLLAVARRFLRDEEAARDAVQETFFSAFRAIHRFDGHSQLSTWLHRIVVNASLMRLRTRQRRAEQSLEPLLPTFGEDGQQIEPVMSWTECPEQLLAQKETRAIIRAAIGELPDSHRAVLLMRDIEGLSTQEAADVLGISENALKLRLHRARLALGTIVRTRLGGAAAPAPAARSVKAISPALARRVAATWQDRFAGVAIPAAAM